VTIILPKVWSFEALLEDNKGVVLDLGSWSILLSKSDTNKQLGYQDLKRIGDLSEIRVHPQWERNHRL
jgi:hypothetical protein